MTVVLRIQADGTVPAQSEYPVGAPVADEQTPNQLALTAPITDTFDEVDGYCRVQYRALGAPFWREAHPLIRASDVLFAGTIFGLEPDTVYEVRLLPGLQGQSVATQSSVPFTTRALPPTAGAATVTCLTTDDFQTKLNSLVPGDVLELVVGTHTIVSDVTISVSGTAQNPIYIRGASQAGTILDQTSGAEITIMGDYLVFENMTLVGKGGEQLDSAAQRAFLIGDGSASTVRTDITIRNIKSSGFGRQVQTAGGAGGSYAHRTLVYNCELLGVAGWTVTGITTNKYWNEDGIRLVGHGNCVWNVTLDGQGDGITWSHSPSSIDNEIYANFAYENLIRNCNDDCFEFDYAARNVGAYDNYCENIRPLMSFDPTGPAVYCFRNVAVNVATRPFKMNSSGFGWLIYNNTILRSETYNTGVQVDDQTAGIDRGWSKLNSTKVNKIAYRNNLLLYTQGLASGAYATKEVYRLRELAGNRAQSEDGIQALDWTNNAHYPDIGINFQDGAGSFTNLADAQANMPASSPLFPADAGLGGPTVRMLNDVISEQQPFQNAITLGSDASTEVQGQVLPTLSGSSALRNSGFNIPGITDEHDGGAPDVGAVIGGRASVQYGPVLTHFGIVAAALTPGTGLGDPTSYNDMPQQDQNPLHVYGNEISWSGGNIFHDTSHGRDELQILCGPQSGVTENHQHYIYDLRTRLWRTTGTALFPAQGHVWCYGFDYEEGDYYFVVGKSNSFYRMDRSLEAGLGATNSPWVPLANVPAGTEESYRGGGWHPNLFGAGDPGFVMLYRRGFYGWRRNTNTWHEIEAFPGSSDPRWNLGQGQGVYIPARNQLLLGAGPNVAGQAANVLFWIDSGSNGNPPAAPSYEVGLCPLIICGTNNAGDGCLLHHPVNSDHILALENAAGGDVYESTDGGHTWSGVIATSPGSSGMQASVGNNHSRGLAEAYQTFVFLSAKTDGGIDTPTFRLWKPPA